MPSFKKRIPPPPREPGTHTNAEVKEALHARALRRTIVVAAIVILLLAALAVVYSSAREKTDTAETRTPRMVLIVAADLTPEVLSGALAAGKAPFIRLLSTAGALKGELQTPGGAGSRLVQLLIGSTATAATNLNGLTSFLRTLKSSGIKPLIAAPSSAWSGTVATDSATCAKTGLYDTECSGLACPAETAAAYCNAFRKYVTCDNISELYQYQVTEAFLQGIASGSDLVYVQVPGLTEPASQTVSSVLRSQSQINLLDNAIGQIAKTVVQRTKSHTENWNIILVGAAGNTKTNKVPFFTTVYSTKGELVQLQTSLPASASTTDIRATVLQWFDKDTSSIDATRLLGICSKGSILTNCQ